MGKWVSMTITVDVREDDGKKEFLLKVPALQI